MNLKTLVKETIKEVVTEKKLNMFIGVDKPERFEVFKHTYNIRYFI